MVARLPRSDLDRDLVRLRAHPHRRERRPGPIEVIASDDAELDTFAARERTSRRLQAVRPRPSTGEQARGRRERRRPARDRRSRPGSSGGARSADRPRRRRERRARCPICSPADRQPRVHRRRRLARAPGSGRVIGTSSVRQRSASSRDSPHPGVDLAALVAPELVPLPAHDGLELCGWLYRPRGASGPGADGAQLPRRPRRSGAARLQQRPTRRCSRGHRACSRRTSAARPASASASSTSTTARCATTASATSRPASTSGRAAGVADPKRLGIMGGSYGGYMVMAGLTEYPDLFAAGADSLRRRQLRDLLRAHRAVDGGDLDRRVRRPGDRGRPAARASRRSTRSTGSTRRPIVLHGANDTNVPVVEAEQVVDSLKAPRRAGRVRALPRRGPRLRARRRTASAPRSRSCAGSRPTSRRRRRRGPEKQACDWRTRWRSWAARVRRRARPSATAEPPPCCSRAKARGCSRSTATSSRPRETVSASRPRAASRRRSPPTSPTKPRSGRDRRVACRASAALDILHNNVASLTGGDAPLATSPPTRSTASSRSTCAAWCSPASTRSRS